MDSILTEIKDGVRCANHTNTQFQCEDHIDLIFEQLAKECGFSNSDQVKVWIHQKDKDLSIQFDPVINELWVEYQHKSAHAHIETPFIFEFVVEVLSFIRNFYMNRKT
tara:strand:- start:9246 stop:9569 length:324 start_codon:yes stop_codon:yes gene_type:complete